MSAHSLARLVRGLLGELWAFLSGVDTHCKLCGYRLTPKNRSREPFDSYCRPCLWERELPDLD